MSKSILAGIETEYGLLVEGRATEDQLDESAAFVSSYPGPCHIGWDYGDESPRADLRGFVAAHLRSDPTDAKFGSSRSTRSETDLRSDRILPNGARLYSDHGHPEYSTPECWSLSDLALHDRAGELVMLDCASAYEAVTGRKARLYKNNTDYHGASYGTHENYLVPRWLGFDKLYAAVMPMLVVRQVLCGAGKVGSETKSPAAFQMSQRADFLVEDKGIDTLYRRPIFNTRDEPHADHSEWIRLHVISGDANMMTACTRRKVGLVKIALELAMRGESPTCAIEEPWRAMQALSRDETRDWRIGLGCSNWTTAYEVLESYLCAFDALPSGDLELAEVCLECQKLLALLRAGDPGASLQIDWLAKRVMLESYIDAEGITWREPILQSLDLEYHNLDRAESLYHALVEDGRVEAELDDQVARGYIGKTSELTRAFARGCSVSNLGDKLVSANWRKVVLDNGDELIEISLPPGRTYPPELAAADSVEGFIRAIEVGNV